MEIMNTSIHGCNINARNELRRLADTIQHYIRTRITTSAYLDADGQLRHIYMPFITTGITYYDNYYSLSLMDAHYNNNRFVSAT